VVIGEFLDNSGLIFTSDDFPGPVLVPLKVNTTLMPLEVNTSGPPVKRTERDPENLPRIKDNYCTIFDFLKKKKM